MTADTVQSVIKTFKFSYPTCTNDELLFKLEVPVEIPHDGSTRELVQRVISMFHIPVYLEDELNESLQKFVEVETHSFHNERDERLLEQLKSGELDVDVVVKEWEKQFKDNVVEFADQKGNSDEEVFAAAYHKLVHSPALETILQVENSYAVTVMETLNSRDEDMRKLTQRQTEEMEQKVRSLGTSSTEQEINALVAEQFSEAGLTAARWASQIDALKQTQRAQHRAWLMDTLERYQTTCRLDTPSNSPLAKFSISSPLAPPPPLPLPPPPARLEESFTIHLGSQLKHTHNLRIISMDMQDLCRSNYPSVSIQTPLSLYSTELSGLVLLSESPPPAPHCTAAAAATEHHFPDLDTQLRCILDRVQQPAEERNKKRLEQSDSNTNAATRARSKRPLHTGDVYITKHSNLADVHVIFHLVVDDNSLKSNELTSRAPALLGLRSVVRAACASDVTALALPLLLRDEFTEEMTVGWCVRRAELVLKCVKGFVLEGAGGGGAELATLALVLPPVQPALFHVLANTLTNVFRTNNPLKLTAN